MQLSIKERDALGIIAGCPDGVTADALEANGHSPDTVAELMALGFVDGRILRMARPKSLKVLRFWVTPAGKAFSRRTMQ